MTAGPDGGGGGGGGGKLAQDGPVFIRQGDRGVQDEEDQRGRPRHPPGPLYARALDRVRRFPQAGSVDKAERDPADDGRLLDGVPRRSGHGAREGAVLSQEQIQERGLADVRPADDGRRRPLADGPSRVKTPQQKLQPFERAARPFDQTGRGLDLDVLIGEIDGRLELGGNPDQLFPHRLQLPRESPGEVSQRPPEARLGARRDQVRNRFGLNEVHPAVQKGAPRELARPGRRSAAIDQEPQDRAEREGAAVAVNLGDVLARVGVRAGHNRQETLVEDFARLRVRHMAVEQFSG